MNNFEKFNDTQENNITFITFIDSSKKNKEEGIFIEEISIKATMFEILNKNLKLLNLSNSK